MKIDVSRLYLIRRSRLALVLFYIGIFIAYYGSLNPWFMWKLGSYFPIPACAFLIGSLLISRTTQPSIFTRNDYLPAFASYIVLSVYLLIVNDRNLNGYIMGVFLALIFFSLFKVNKDLYQRTITLLAKSMAILLIISISGFFLFLFGFPLPTTNAEFNEFYSYTNYYFFLIDDRFMYSIVPRFTSVFLEPSHLGTAAVLLLLCQCGHWKRWYNMVLIVATFLTFSLGAYVLFVVIIFLHLWMQGKQLVRKLIFTLALLAAATVTAFVYNNGENLVHDLILLRLEMDEGKLAGDNRVSTGFQEEFDSFLSSDDILFGREMDTTVFGNSGYRVFIYENGIVGTVLLFVFYFFTAYRATNKRALISMAIISLLIFIVNAFMLWFNTYIPLMMAAYMTGKDFLPVKAEEKEEEEE